MAKKNKKRRSPNERKTPPLPVSDKDEKPTPRRPPSHQATRETVESLVIALVLAFLFRTFQAEAFVIPTGSMSPTLMGRHKDVYCDQCGQRFKVNASEEGKSPNELAASPQFRNQRMTAKQLVHESETIAGLCQNCRYPMPFTRDLPRSVPVDRDSITAKNSSSGDRILVNKYLYSFTDPQRWDVVVFKYPGDAQQNYIKRLVGLPGETLRLYQGDVYTKPGSNNDNAESYAILRKPADKVVAMRQLVHDTRHDPASLYEAGWPLRWQPDRADGWQVDKEVKGKNVRQGYHVQAGDGQTEWLRYRHTPATPSAWRKVRQRLAAGKPVDGALAQHADRNKPSLVTDFNSYNTEVPRYPLTRAVNQGTRDVDLELPPGLRGLQGVHWAGDLSVDADIKIESAEGVLLLELVEAGQHFRCEIDLVTGEATLRVLAFETQNEVLSIGSAPTSIRGKGSHRLRFANVDDQLLLWVDGALVAFEQGGAYEADDAFGQNDRLVPKTSDADPGDLAPAAIGARDAAVRVDRLQVFRDLYYIAVRWNGRGQPMTDYPLSLGEVTTADGRAGQPWQVAGEPRLWPAIADRRSVEFEVADGQYFVMGDNSPASKDCRVWTSDETRNRPGGLYLEESLLTGKAVCVYWPHALVSIPTPKQNVRIPIVPNLGDIRLVR